MWRYILLLAVFNLVDAVSLFSARSAEQAAHFPEYTFAWFNVIGVLFLVACLSCLVNVFFRFREGETRRVFHSRFVAQGVSLAVALIVLGVTIWLWLSGLTPVSNTTVWLFIAVGQAIMIRPFDTRPPNEAGEEEALRQTIDQQKGK